MLKKITVIIVTAFLLVNCTIKKEAETNKEEKILAIHLLDYTSDEKLKHLEEEIPKLADRGINLIFLEIDYHFDFKSHPELISRSEYITKDAALKLKQVCDANGIRLVPQFQSFGHQSWAKDTYELLTVYPELDLTPGAFPDNEGIYCRAWDPYNPKVNEIVFPLIDEIIDAFQADGIHLGMDETFLIDAPEAISTRDKNPAEVFAKVINDFHDYFAKQKEIELFIWGDRLIDGNTYKYGAWESSLNNTSAAVDLIPNDIVICDWHYEPRASYPSVPMFIEKGFKVLPSSWRKLDGLEKYVKYSYNIEHPNMLGHLFTTWSFRDSVSSYKPLVFGTNLINSGKLFDVSFEVGKVNASNEVEVKLNVGKQNLDIFYTSDGSVPNKNSLKYDGPLNLNQSTVLKALAFDGLTEKGAVTSKGISLHKGLKGSIKSHSKITDKFEANNGIATMIDGQLGSAAFSDGHWVGYDAIDLDIELTFEMLTKVESIQLRLFNDKGNWIYPPESISILSSENGVDYNEVSSVSIGDSNDKIVSMELEFNPITLKHLRIKAVNSVIPEGRNGAGNNTWIFTDELIVN